MREYDLDWDEVLVVADSYLDVTSRAYGAYHRLLWRMSVGQIPKLVAALRDLGHIPEPEPLGWYTVERHGQPEAEMQIVMWVRPSADRRITRTRAGAKWWPQVHYLPLSALRGHTELPGWNDLAPAPEPELPAPWLAPVHFSAMGDDDFVCCAVAFEEEVVVIEKDRPGKDRGHVAWCPIRSGEEVPPHPYARAER